MTMLVHAAAPKGLNATEHRSLIGLRVVVLLLIVLAASFCWWAKGRGYLTAIKRLVLAQEVVLPPVNITLSRPADGATGVATDVIIHAETSSDSGAIDIASANSLNVMLIRTGDQEVIASSVDVSGTGRLRLTPRSPLQPGTTYTLYVTSGLKTVSGNRAVPYQISFTTAAPVDPVIRFRKIALGSASDIGVTSLQVGPDQLLYAGADDGRILRFPIAADGGLGTPTVISSLQRAEGGPRLLTGFCFDPASTADVPIIWTAHGFYGFNDAPDWSGKITRLSGKNLQRVEDVVVNLPRSVRDHLTNQPSFGPDGALYFPQGSNTAFGAPDDVWGNRQERLLSAAILRLDVRRVKPGEPLEVRTPDGGGQYNPFLPDAPLTIYAFGVRLAYDLVWTKQGHLYVPVNGSSAGGNAPGALALNNLPISEDDWLFRVIPGKYYGHPNPQQGHHILNGGNPTSGYDFAEVPQYPVGTQPDPNWVPAAHVFGKHVSANGIIQYQSNAFGGKLRDKLLVCRYNVPGDIAVLQINSDGSVTPAVMRIPGFTNLSNPLDLVEDPRTGCLYVSEYGSRCITLLQPIEQ